MTIAMAIAISITIANAMAMGITQCFALQRPGCFTWRTMGSVAYGRIHKWISMLLGKLLGWGVKHSNMVRLSACNSNKNPCMETSLCIAHASWKGAASARKHILLIWPAQRGHWFCNFQVDILAPLVLAQLRDS